MGTTIRPELSEKNPYWIEKHRYYELKHFCLQYPIWRKAYSVLDGYSNPPKDLASVRYMISNNTSTCQDCGGKLKYYDKVRRIVRTKGRVSKWVNVPRYQCSECGCIHRYLPDYIYPYKQYESEIIAGVIEGLITCETFGYEDYPCEMTMIRWKAHKSQLLL